MSASLLGKLTTSLHSRRSSILRTGSSFWMHRQDIKVAIVGMGVGPLVRLGPRGAAPSISTGSETRWALRGESHVMTAT
jgi:hypothetical protein